MTLNNKMRSKILSVNMTVNNKNPRHQLAVAVTRNDLSRFVDLLTHSDQRIDLAFRRAYFKGRTEMVKLLLPKIDPSYNENDAIRTAASEGYSQLVKVLLEHPKVDPSVGSGYPLRVACQKGYYSTVKILLQHPKVDPSHYRYDAVFNAIRRSDKNMVRLLLNSTAKITDTELIEDFIEVAIKTKRMSMLNLLRNYFKFELDSRIFKLAIIYQNGPVNRYMINKTKVEFPELIAVNYATPETLKLALDAKRWIPTPQSIISMLSDLEGYYTVIIKAIPKAKMTGKTLDSKIVSLLQRGLKK